ncbi:PKD domain-containing protein [Haliovirga abyssi]|uniref:PKD domain-containing protein n=1 Tax=Haliovirga abyssi TaxID=2996794 RepID=A0AAU9DK42_9FUSO|nr:PKD domain-containing protein [Haliovirga abyssi]BDU51269.1 hypothetical protein HLVA_18380 [Haliovirga abyssi]
MWKKGVLLFLLVFSFGGCFSSDSSNKLNTVTTNTDQSQITTKDVISSGGKDSNLIIRILSKPPISGASTSVVFQFLASQDGYSSDDFLYHYDLQGEGNSVAENILESDEYVSNKKLYYSSLKEGVKYTFSVSAYNKKTGKISNSSAIYQFTTTNTTQNIDVKLNYVKTDKSSYNIGDSIKVIYNLTNSSDKEYSLLTKPVFNTTPGYVTTNDKNESFTITNTDMPDKIAANSTITFTETYTILPGTIEGNFYTKLMYANTKVEFLGENGASTGVQSPAFTVVDSSKAKVKLKSVDAVYETVAPGQSNILIRYTVQNYTSVEVSIKSLVGKFYKPDGTDVSSEWQATGDSDRLTTIPAGGLGTISKRYNLASTATTGDVFCDATVNAILSNSFGLKISDSGAEVLDTVKVLAKGTGSLNLWIASPEGAKDGVVETEQEFTVYGIVNYNGELTFSTQGEIELDLSDLDGITLLSGVSKTTLTMNKQMTWTLKASKIPIVGNIKLKITKKPVDSKTKQEISFVSTEKVIPLTVQEKSKLNLEVGIETDNYGGNDGLLRTGKEFSMYAIANNANSNVVSGNVKVAIDISSVADLKLAAGETIEKVVPVGQKAIWKLNAPTVPRIGSVKFKVVETPINQNTNEATICDLEKNYTVDIKLPGALALKNVYCDWENVKPGRDGIPIKFDLENSGNEDVKITSIKAVFTQNGVDVSDRWTLTDTTIRDNTILLKGSVLTLTGYYKLRENIGDGTDLLGDIIISGEATGYDDISKEVLTDNLPRYGDVITVDDTVPPVAVISASKTTVEIGEDIVFDGTGSTDNDKIRYYSWDFDSANGVDESVPGGIIHHSYDKPGIYKVTLQVNDMSNNGPATATILITVQDTIAPVAIAGVRDGITTISVGGRIAFDGSGSSDNYMIKSYSWNFGDGTAPNGSASPEHTYSTAGSYTATLTVTDVNGNIGTATIGITVK